MAGGGVGVRQSATMKATSLTPAQTVRHRVRRKLSRLRPRRPAFLPGAHPGETSADLAAAERIIELARHRDGAGSTGWEVIDRCTGPIRRGNGRGASEERDGLSVETRLGEAQVSTPSSGWRPRAGVGQGRKSVEAG